jgi:hypothetical protein
MDLKNKSIFFFENTLDKNCQFFIKYIYIQMENGRMMILHSAIIGVLLYIFMFFILGQNKIVAENRSILLAAAILMYMILFGHGLPTSINKNLY